ncbi:hypothetical protein KEM52_006662 [Ascosphaera acerosa]|nr:hypothetical protein KEM52_006662 [Ascosphaera acerosa]
MPGAAENAGQSAGSRHDIRDDGDNGATSADRRSGDLSLGHDAGHSSAMLSEIVRGAGEAPSPGAPTPAPTTPQTRHNHDQQHVRETEEEQQQPAHTSQPSPPSTSTPASAAPPSSAASPTEHATDDVRRCWICYSDETEDPTPKPVWRHPCPCALTAHEPCLLDWLADLESPAARRRHGGGAGHGGQLRPRARIYCPQCKAEIVVRRPRNWFVDAVRALEGAAARLLAPGIVGALVGVVWAGCCLHGLYAFRLVFGAADAHRRLMAGPGLLRRLRVNLGLPLIPVVLVCARTRWADRALPAVSWMVYFMLGRTIIVSRGGVAQVGAGGAVGGHRLWPPGPALTFAALPVLRNVYNTLLYRLFGQAERRWIAAVRPRATEPLDERQALPQRQQQHEVEEEQEAVEQQDAEQVDADEIVAFNLQIQLNFGMDNDDDDAVIVDAEEERRGEGEGGNAPQAQAPVPAAAAAAAPAPVGGGGGAAAAVAAEPVLYGNIAETVLGALAFPAVASGMGSLLKLVLPPAWTSLGVAATAASTSAAARRAAAPPSGLLQTKWGRSVVGGCLFVLLKDLARLYCRWKIAQSHRQRRVLDYDRRLKRVVE